MLAVGMLLSSCNAVKTSNTLGAAAMLKHQLTDAVKLYDDSLVIYKESEDFFTPVEQRLIQRGLDRIDIARVEIERLYDSNGVDVAVNYARFMQSWKHAREGYTLVRGVLKSKEGISEPHQQLILYAHEKVVYLDYLVDQITPKDTSIDYQAIAGIITATASIIGNVRPVVQHE